MTKTEVTREELSFPIDLGKLESVRIAPYKGGWEWEVVVSGRMWQRGFQPTLLGAITRVMEATEPWQKESDG